MPEVKDKSKYCKLSAQKFKEAMELFKQAKKALRESQRYRAMARKQRTGKTTKGKKYGWQKPLDNAFSGFDNFGL